MAADLTNLNRVKATAFPNVTDTSADNVIQTLITAASRAAETWCKRTFSVVNYDEIYDSDGSGSLLLRNFPVLSLTRMAMSSFTVLTLRNTDTTNSRAWISTVQVAQQDVPTPTTGVQLVRVNQGVSIVDATYTWNVYPTIQALANAVATLGKGWTATVAPGYGNWSSNDITPIRGAQNALNSNGNLNAFVTDLNDYDLVAETGEVRFSGSFSQLFGTGWLPGNFPGMDLYPGVNLPRGSRNIRCQYTAGFNQIPDNVQQAVALWTAHLYQQAAYAGNLTSESLADYSYTRAVTKAPPPDVHALLAPFRDYKI